MENKDLTPKEREKIVSKIKNQANELYKLVQEAQEKGISITIQFQNNVCNFIETFL